MVPYCTSPGAAVRILTLAKYLKEEGFMVKLVAAKGNKISYFGLKSIADYIEPIYVEDFVQERRTRPFRSDAKKENANVYELLSQSLKNIVKNIVRALSLPDIGILSIPKFLLMLYPIIKTADIDTVIVSSPPHSSQIISLLLKIIFKDKICLVVDYRDGWNTFDIFRESNFVKRSLTEKVEKKVLMAADFFMYQSPSVFEQITSHFKIDYEEFKSKSELVRNGYTDLPFLHNNDLSLGQHYDEDCFSLGYFGGLDFSSSGYRNPSLILEHLDNLGIEINVICFGQVLCEDRCADFKNISIIFNETIDMDQAKALMKKCDGLLSFHAHSLGSEVIPGKFYEYIDSCRPILSVGPFDMECGKIISEYGFGVHLSYDELDKHRGSLLNFFSSHQFDVFISNLFEKKYLFDRSYQYAKCVTRLVELNDKCDT